MDQKGLQNKNESQGNEPWRKNVRVAIYTLAGVYLLTLAYDLFHAIETSKGNTQLIMIVATVLFTIIGIGMVIFGITVTYRNAKQLYDEMKTSPPDDEA